MCLVRGRGLLPVLTERLRAAGGIRPNEEVGCRLRLSGKAARGTDGRLYPGARLFRGQVQHGGYGHKHNQARGLFPRRKPARMGCEDLSGNVWSGHGAGGARVLKSRIRVSYDSRRRAGGT